MTLARVIELARWAKRMDGTGPLSTGEALTAALMLNRHDWLHAMDYTIAEALGRIDEGTLPRLAHAARHVAQEVDRG